MDGTGKIRYTEFLAATIESLGVISEERLAEAFDRIDSDDSGYISVQNLSEMLGNDFPKQEIDAILKEISRDGKVSYSEFLAIWEDRQEQQRAEMIKEIMAPDSPHSVTISVMTDELESWRGTANHLARAAFIQGKKQSERRSSSSGNLI